MQDRPKEESTCRKEGKALHLDAGAGELLLQALRVTARSKQGVKDPGSRSERYSVITVIRTQEIQMRGERNKVVLKFS